MKLLCKIIDTYYTHYSYEDYILLYVGASLFTCIFPYMSVHIRALIELIDFLP